jgi:hypothetical protein
LHNAAKYLNDFDYQEFDNKVESEEMKSGGFTEVLRPRFRGQGRVERVENLIN